MVLQVTFRQSNFVDACAVTVYNKTVNVCVMYIGGAFVQKLLQWKSNKYYIFCMCVCVCVCVCSLSYPNAMRMLHIASVVCHAPQYFSHCLINSTIFD